MCRKLFFPGGMLAGLLASQAGATVLVAMEIEELAVAAPTVLVGEVNQIASGWDTEGTRIYTRVWITPTEVLKGPRKLGTITVKTIGGQVGDVVAQLPGAPRFEPGERVLLFLEPRKDQDGYLTIGLYQGKFKVFNDPKTGKELLLRDGPEIGVKLVGIDAVSQIQKARALDEVRELVRRAGGVK